MAITDTKNQIIEKRGYDKNISGDQYSLYLSSYPIAAEYLAGRLSTQGSSIAELCCGIGVNLCALAKYNSNLIGVELDKTILENCRKNLLAQDFEKKIKLINGDVSNTEVLKSIKADIVIYDIPFWVSKVLPDGSNVLNHNPNLEKLIKNIRNLITENIVVFAPTYFEYKEISDTLGNCEFEKIYINGRYDRNYIYFGNLINKLGITEKYLKY